MVRRVHNAGGYSQHLGLRGRHPRREADHVPQRGNRAVRADAPRRHGGPRREAAGARSNHAAGRPPRGSLRRIAGSRAKARCWSRPGPRRDAMRRRHGQNTHAMPGAVPVTAETGLAAAAGNGTPQPPLRTAAQSASRASRSNDCESAESRKGRRIAHHNSATPRPPRARGARPNLHATPPP